MSEVDIDSGLLPPPALSPADQLLDDAFSRLGLHPYRIPVGMKHIPGCMECAGRKCPRQCKMDAKSAGVMPALATNNAELVSDFQVTRLQGTNEQITSVEGLLNGELHNVKGRIVVVAAGGLGSPALLLASASEHWPNGCANRSDLVGRNLMFHLNDLAAVWPPGNAEMHGPAKNLSLRDFYHVDGQRFGTFQALGMSASYGNIVQYLNERFDRSLLHRIRILREFTRIPALAASHYFGAARIFSGIVEDLPYLDNRVLLTGSDQDSLKVQYEMHDELLERWKKFHRIVSARLSGVRHYFITQNPTLNFGHPCGTVRFGDDPKLSVLDPDCRSHDIGNLFVVDSSFMPTSTGVNPSLTIAANALRVADAIVSQLRTDTMKHRPIEKTAQVY